MYAQIIASPTNHNKEHVPQGSSVMLDKESDGIGYLSGSVQSSVDILHFSWSCKLLGFDA
jgi:hypothetical protein